MGFRAEDAGAGVGEGVDVGLDLVHEILVFLRVFHGAIEEPVGAEEVVHPGHLFDD